MDKLASQILFKTSSSAHLLDSFHLDDSDLDSDEESNRRPLVIKPVVPIKYDTLDKEKISRAHQEILGRLSLVWSPPEGCPNVDCPETYHRNSGKEKLLLWFCENFRRQYCLRYPLRRPLILALQNECGVQKMVCTSINVTRFPLSEFKSWQGCARFVSDHIGYEALDHPTNLPGRLRSPATVFLNQTGHCFELSTLLVSLLLGAKIQAYVVSGYATREVCNNDQCRVECPLLPGSEPPSSGPDEAGPARSSKYVPKPIPDFKSKFERMMEQRRVDEEEERRRQEEAEERRRVAELERLPSDDLRGRRLHSWVLVRGAGEVFFLEPITGRRADLEDEEYLGVESVWNHKNYWVNLQSASSCKDLNFTLGDRKLWQPLLLSGPKNRSKPALERKDTTKSGMNQRRKSLIKAMNEKCLDIPVTWTKDLDITLEKYIRGRYKNNKKQVQYKRAISEQYSDYKHPNGLVERVVRYVDLECEVPSRKYEKYRHRADRLYYCDTNYETELVQEFFQQGRPDSLQYHSHLLGQASELRSPRTLDFHLSGRLDRFHSAQLDINHFRFKFAPRADKLREIFVEYLTPRKKRSASVVMEDRNLDEMDMDKAVSEAQLVDQTNTTVSNLSMLKESTIPPILKSPANSPKVLNSPVASSPKIGVQKPSTLDSPKSYRSMQKPSVDSPKSFRSAQKASIDSLRTGRSTQKSPSPKTGTSKLIISDSLKPVVDIPNASLEASKSDGETKSNVGPVEPSKDEGKTVRYDRPEEGPLLGGRDIRSFYVRYDRTPGSPHDEDVSKVIFNLQYGEISVYYHYGDNNITQSYRKFQTSLPSLDDLPDSVKCYQSGGSPAKPDSKQFLTKLYTMYTRLQDVYLDTINRYTREIRTLLNSRKIDKYKPKLVTNIFYLEIDEEIRNDYCQELEKKRKEELRKLALRFNYAELYLSGLNAKGLGEKETAAARAKCLQDLKTVWKTRVEHFEAKLDRIRRDIDALDRQKDLGGETVRGWKKDLGVFGGEISPGKKDVTMSRELNIQSPSKDVADLNENDGGQEGGMSVRNHVLVDKKDRSADRDHTLLKNGSGGERLLRKGQDKAVEDVTSLCERREALENERELVQRVLREYKTPELFRAKCARVEESFDEYARRFAEQR